MSDSPKRSASKRSDVPERGEGGELPKPWVLALFLLIAGGWAVALMRQSLAPNFERWMLWLVPDQVVSGWFDGPVTWQGIWDRALLLGVALLTWGIAGSVGWCGFGGVRITKRLSPSERTALFVTLGLVLQGTAILIVGLAGALQHWWTTLVVVALALLMAVGLRVLQGSDSQRGNFDSEPGHDESHAGYSRFAALICAGIATGLILLRAVLPPAEYDTREYHLEAPKEWWQAGEITFMEHNIYANMPMAAESHVLFTTGLWDVLGGRSSDAWWWGALVGKLLLAGFVVLTALLVKAMLRLWLLERGRAEHDAVWAADWLLVVALSVPAIVEVGTLGMIEQAVAAFAALGLLAAQLLWSCDGTEANKDNEASNGQVVSERALAIIAGLAMGGAIGCKYPAVVFVMPLIAVACGLAIRARRQADNSATRISMIHWTGLAILGLLLGGAMWYVKNWWLAGNPVYPLAGNLFGGRDLDAATIEQWNAGHRPPGYSLRLFWESLRNVTWGWRLQGWCLVPLCMIGLTTWRRESLTRLIVAAGAVTFLGWWLLTHRVERFLLPSISLVLVMAGIGLDALRSASSKRVTTACIAVLLAMNMYFVMGPAIGDARLAVSLDYLRQDNGSESTTARLGEHVAWVNANLTSDTKLLVVGDAAVFDYEVPILYSTTFDRSLLVDLTSGDEASWGARFQQSGATHVLVHWGEIQRLRSTYGFDDRITMELFEKLESRGVLRVLTRELNGGAVWVYEVAAD